MRMVIQIVVVALIGGMLAGCRQNPGPLGRMNERDRHRTIVIDRSDEEVSIDERRNAGREETEARWLLPWTWF